MGKIAALALCVGLFFVVLPAPAGQWDKATTVTFAQPVELPNIVLQPGTYVFRLLDTPGNRHVVQVFNAEETKLYTTILAIPNSRLTPTEKTVIPFEERPAGMPEAMHAWFYPGDNFGQEFVYPKARAAEIAKTAQEPVLSAEITPSETPAELLGSSDSDASAGKQGLIEDFHAGTRGDNDLGDSAIDDAGSRAGGALKQQAPFRSWRWWGCLHWRLR